MSRTVLFDLDGTLLNLDIEEFLRHYMRLVGAYFSHVAPPEKFTRAIWASTNAMIANLDPSLTNHEAFAAHFEPLVGRPWEEMWPGFMDFYVKEFPRLRGLSKEDGVAFRVLSQCSRSGWNLILATNPIFPEIAIRERLRWCDAHEIPWKFITHIDNMHFCKPHLQYYEEIVRVCGLDPSRCVMVGNDVQEDMVAKSLGMKTYLVEGLVIDRGGGPEPDLRGPLAQVPEAIEKLLPL
ncbi:MAG TPA: HAD family hydrolase [Firmicutes bacterium]|nr:HAD family hydrolase [Candidatus Fermentithermobacillaceae bacterium]